jgi:hypothetical protein
VSYFIVRARRFVGRWKRTSADSADLPATSGLTCNELVELASAYIDGTLAPKEARRFDDHLAVCDGCTRYLDQLRITVRLTGTLREVDVQPEAREALLGAFRNWKDGRNDLDAAFGGASGGD